MKRPQIGFKVFMLTVLLLCLISNGWTQTGGSLAGKVVDAREKFGLPTVQIAIVGTNIFGKTDAEGNFVIRNIPEGVYRVVFDLPGYVKYTKKDITITAGQTTELNIELRMGFAHETTVTARRAIEKLQEVPQNVDVVTSEELAETPVTNLHRALENITGVDVTASSGNVIAGSWIYIDGYESSYIKQMVDGVEISGVIESWTLSNSYPETMIDQIEVIKGGSSSAWGSNMGGIINYTTKRPKNMERPQFTLKGSFSHFGEWDYGNASVNPNPGGGNFGDISASAMGNFDKLGYMVGVRHNKHDGFIDFGGENLSSVFAKIGYDISERTYVDLFYTYNKLLYKVHYFMDFPAGVRYWDYTLDTDMNTQVGYAKLTSRLTNALNLEASLKYYNTGFDSTYADLMLDFSSPSNFHERRLGATVKADYRPSLEFSLVAGADYYRIKADLFNEWSYSDVAPMYVNQYAPFVNAEYHIGPLGLNAGFRYDYDSSFKEDQLSPSFGANFSFGKASLIRLNVGRTFRIPPILYTIVETFAAFYLPNPDLKPERAWAYSAGFESQELNNVWLKLSFYLHNMTDGISPLPVESGPNAGRLMWSNLSEFTRKGYEAELGVIAPFGLQAYVGTNYNDHTEKTPEGDSVVTWIPTRTYRIGLKYKNEKLDILANIRGRWLWWNVADEFIQALLEPHDKQWVIDLRLSKGFKVAKTTNFSIFLDVFNMLDVLYWDRKDVPSPRRWAQIGFELNFQ